ncbi:orotate phosphoribosyltransferase [Nitrobacter sp. Nb-311A]|nr:orotate phosphoribosyltransferase [Nitrobacter sp. Nb-311A]
MDTMAPQFATSTEPGAVAEDNNLRQRAFEIIQTRSFGRGDIKLSSGKSSTFYFDMKPTMLSPEGANVLSELILARLFGRGINYIGGLEMGAVPLISSVSLLSHIKKQPLPGFFVRKEIKKHGTQRLIEGIPNGSLSGKKVVILEDVTTSGESAMIAVAAAQAAGALVVMVLSIVDRGEGAVAFYKEKNIEFDSLFTAGEFLDS